MTQSIESLHTPKTNRAFQTVQFQPLSQSDPLTSQGQLYDPTQQEDRPSSLNSPRRGGHFG
jgi:hypothetical protein